MTKTLLALSILLLSSAQVFSTGTMIAQNDIAIHSEDSTLSEKILNELKVIRFHADKTDQLREEVIKRYENKNEDLPDNNANASIVSAEYEVLSEIEGHTKENPIKDGWNLYGWIAFFLSVTSIIYSIITYRAQKKVEEQTKNASLNVQCGILDDLYRHLYRNLVCTCAILYKFRGINGVKSNKEYPSEVNLMKLTTLPEDVIISIDIKGDDIYSQMHEIKKLLKNYNMEIEIASNHFSCKEIEDKYLANDYDNLMYKPLFLITKVFTLWDKFHDHNKTLDIHKHEYAIYKFVKEHFEKLTFDKTDYKETLTYLRKTNDLLVNRNPDKSIFDCLISIKSVEDNGIQRALNQFCDPIPTDNSYMYKGRKIKKTEFNNYLKQHGSDKVEELINEKTSKITIQGKKKKELISLLKPYSDFFTKEEWMLDELLFHILRINIALEIPKIGMINYHSQK